MGQYSHPLLVKVWRLVASDSQKKEITNYGRYLSAISYVKQIEERQDSDLLEIHIRTCRPYQIRIHLIALGSQLAGDMLYLLGGEVSPKAIPGFVNYYLHSY